MKTHPVRSDQRYTVTREHTGNPAKKFVVRFCGDWVDSFATYPGAVMRAAGESAVRRGALVVTEKVA